MSNSELGAVVSRIHKALESAKKYEDNLNGKFKEAMSQSSSFKLLAEYSRASERDALIDIMINLSGEEGQRLMRSVARVTFQETLAVYSPDLVRINQGLLTHKVTKETAFSVNILGWK